MTIYVDELPKKCEDCKLGWFYDCQYCILRQDLMEQDKWCEKEKHCPLQSLSDYTKQVRKEVCEEIKEHVLKHFNVKTEKEYEKSLSLLDALFTADVVFEILDQIQGEKDD